MMTDNKKEKVGSIEKLTLSCHIVENNIFTTLSETHWD